MSDAARIAQERWSAAEAARREREGHWRELLNFVVPAAATYEETIHAGQDGAQDQRERRILDSTASESAALFASFLVTDVFLAGNATAEALIYEPIRQDGTVADTVADSPDVKQYLHHLARQIRTVLWAGERTAIIPIQDACFDLGWCGTAILAAWENAGPDRDRFPLVFQRYSPWQCAGDPGHDGRVSAIYIKETLTNRQAAMRWPDAGIDGTASVSEEYVYVCMEANDPDAERMFPAAVQRGLPWVGGWFNFSGRRRALNSLAYHEQPLFMSRWSSWGARTATVWGRSPASVALGNIMSMHALEETSQRIIDKLGDPPFYVPDGSLIGQLRLYPGGISYGDAERPPSPLLPPGASRVELVDQKLALKQEAVRRAFFVHLMQGQEKSGNPITAEEYRGHERWRNRAVAPMALRQHAELYAPLVRRVEGVLRRRGWVAEPPPALQGLNLRPKFGSPILASQSEMDALAIQRLFELVLPWAQADAKILDNFDFDKVNAVLHRGSGAPASILVPPTVRDRRRAERDEQAAEAAQVQNTAAVLPGLAAMEKVRRG